VRFRHAAILTEKTILALSILRGCRDALLPVPEETRIALPQASRDAILCATERHPHIRHRHPHAGRDCLIRKVEGIPEVEEFAVPGGQALPASPDSSLPFGKECHLLGRRRRIDEFRWLPLQRFAPVLATKVIPYEPSHHDDQVRLQRGATPPLA
jgi:hypothetical protein